MLLAKQYRVKGAKRFNPQPPGMLREPYREFIGTILKEKDHDTNPQRMARLQFDDPVSANIFSNAWFYLDDLEEVE